MITASFSPLVPQSWQCNRGWGASHFRHEAAWQNRSRISWWSRDFPSRPCRGCYWASGLGVQPVHEDTDAPEKEKTPPPSPITWRASSPLGSGGSEQSWWWCRAQHWPLSQRRTSVWGSCPTAHLLSSAPSPGRRTCPHHKPDKAMRSPAVSGSINTCCGSQTSLTSFRVMMLGCCPYRIRISISSDGSLLILSIIWDVAKMKKK